MGKGYNSIEPHVGTKGLGDGRQQGHISHVSPASCTSPVGNVHT